VEWPEKAQAAIWVTADPDGTLTASVGISQRSDLTWDDLVDMLADLVIQEYDKRHNGG
jgi:hypothetical protein